MNGSSITAGRGVLLGFISFYAALFTAFGCFSPFLPAFLTERGLKPEQLGIVLGAATVVRLVCGPLAGRLADRFHFLRAQLAVCALLGAGAALLYLAAQGFWTIMAVSLLQAAALAPLVPLADALSLAHARPRPNKQAFEYGWVRGVGSAAFVVGTLVAGQAASSHGLSATLWLSAAGLLAVPIAAGLVPAFPAYAASQLEEIAHRPWLTLLRQRAFVCVHPHCRPHSRQPCDVRFLCGDPLDAGRDQPGRDRRAVVGVGCGRGDRLFLPGSMAVASAVAGGCPGSGGSLRRGAVGGAR
jgi:MFS family permease